MPKSVQLDHVILAILTFTKRMQIHKNQIFVQTNTTVPQLRHSFGFLNLIDSVFNGYEQLISHTNASELVHHFILFSDRDHCEQP